MNIVNKIIFPTFVFLLTLTSGCKKDTPNPLAPDRTTLLTGKNWKLTALTVDPAKPISNVTDVYSQMDACEKDDLKKFNSDNTVTYDEGGSKCNSSDPQTVNGAWVFNNDKTVLTETRNSESKSYNIKEMSITSYKATYTENALGVTYTYTATYTAQ